MIVEDWTYKGAKSGAVVEGRQVWHVEPPGPKGSGIPYHVIRFKDVKAEDGKWERHIYGWRLCVGHDEGKPKCNCNPKDNEPVEVP